MPGLSQQGRTPGDRELIDIVIIDDDRAAGSLLARALTLQGYCAVNAHDGPSGIARVLQLLPDLVILDVMMPDMDGWQVLHRLKNDKTAWRIPVVMYSALGDPLYREKASKMGATDYWLKAEISSSPLKPRIERVLEKKNRSIPGRLPMAG